jgi:hypothetical protein
MPHPIYRVFISSTFSDLLPERRAVAWGISDLGASLNHLGIALVPVDLLSGADSQPPLEVCLDEVRQCDATVTVIGMKYGSLHKCGRSFTELEYDEGLRHNKNLLCYFKSDRALMLVEQIDTDAKQVALLTAFKSKIDRQRKRDTFGSPEELRGHVLRDLTKWILSQPEVLNSAKKRGAGRIAGVLIDYYNLIDQRRYEDAARFISDPCTHKDLKRSGCFQLYPEMLAELLELNSLNPPSRITDPKTRAYSLIRLSEHNPYSLLGRAALDEAEVLAKRMNDPWYEYQIASRWAELSIYGHCDRHAPQALKQMLQCIRKTKNMHHQAGARLTTAKYYGWINDHKRRRRWLERSVKDLSRRSPTCPFCMWKVHLELGSDFISQGDCSNGHLCYSKALLIARAIPERNLEAHTLLDMARHFDAHECVTQATASYVLCARLMREVDPLNEASDIGKLLGTLIAHHGRERIKNELHTVERDAERVLDEALAEFKLDSFISNFRFLDSPCPDS